MTPYKVLFAVVEGVLHDLGRDMGSDIASQRQTFDGKTVSFSGSAPWFSKFRRFYRERGKAVFMSYRNNTNQP